MADAAAIKLSSDASLESLYGQARKTREQIKALLEKIERTPVPELVSQGLTLLTTLDAILGRCDTILRSLPGARAEVRVGVGDMFTESTTLRNQLSHRQKELDRRRWEEQLKARREQLNGDGNLVAIDTQYKERAAVRNAVSTMHQIHAVGAQVLTGISDQNATLLALKNRVLGMAEQVGITDRLMKMISRRDTVDKIVIWGGMIVVTVLLVLAWYYLRRGR